MLQFLGNISKKIQLLGITKDIEDIERNEKIPSYIIVQDSNFKKVWNIIIIILLGYTATYMPYKTCFIDESSVLADMIDWSVDILFAFDILVNFLSATEKEDGTPINSPKIIARDYLKSWFTLDLLSVLPFSSIESLVPKPEDVDGVGAGNYNQLVRLARLPRLYRMTKLLRLLRMLKTAKKNKYMRKIFQFLNTTPAISRQIRFSFTAILLTHIFACFWFLSAKFMNFHPDTWVYREGLQDANPSTQYLYSLHWATQTVTTVGYGDIPAYTQFEIILSFIWMLVGVAFYSFIIGNFSSIIAGNDEVTITIQNRVQNLSELARKASIPFSTSKKIKQYIENNCHALFSQEEEDKLIKMLPPYLRDEILGVTYGEIIASIKFFRNVTDPDFLWKILPILQKVKLEKGDVLYWKGDGADSMFFILQGRIKLYSDGNPFIKYTNGELFGDSDALLDLPRDGKAIAVVHSQMYSLSVQKFESLATTAQETCLSMIVQARKKRDKHLILIAKMHERKRRKNTVICSTDPIGAARALRDQMFNPPSTPLRVVQNDGVQPASKLAQTPITPAKLMKSQTEYSHSSSPDHSGGKISINIGSLGDKSPILRSKFSMSQSLKQPNQQMEVINEGSNNNSDKKSESQHEKSINSVERIPMMQAHKQKSLSARSRESQRKNQSGLKKTTTQKHKESEDKDKLDPHLRHREHTLKLVGNLDVETSSMSTLAPQMKKRHGTTSTVKKNLISRRASILDKRLDQLKNRNRNVGPSQTKTGSSDISNNLMKKFWNNNIPIIITEKEIKPDKIKGAADDIDKQSKHRSAKGKVAKSNQSHRSASSSSSGNSSLFNKNLSRLQSQPVQLPQPDSSKTANFGSRIRTRSQNHTDYIEENKTPPQSGIGNGSNTPTQSMSLVQRKNIQQNDGDFTAAMGSQMQVNTSNEFNSADLTLTGQNSKPKSNSPKGQKKRRTNFSFKASASLVEPVIKSGRVTSPQFGQLSRRMTLVNIPNKSSRRSGFSSALLGDQKTENFEIESQSKFIKDVHGDKALAMISQRIKKQAQDHYGNVVSYIDHNQSLLPEDQGLFGKLKEKEELDEVVEEEAEDEEDDFKWVQQAPRRTLLDRVVGNIFGKEKQRLYEMYPKLAVITVPKMPIITPKGDEIIHRNKFKTQLQLLNQAYNQKMQLYESENAQEKLTKEQINIVQEETENDSDSQIDNNDLEKSQNSAENDKDSEKMKTSAWGNRSETHKIQKKFTLDKKNKLREQKTMQGDVEIFIETVDSSVKKQEKQIYKSVKTNKSSLSPLNLKRDDSSADVSPLNRYNKDEGKVKRHASFFNQDGSPKNAKQLRRNFASPEVLNKLKKAGLQIKVNIVPRENQESEKEESNVEANTKAVEAEVKLNTLEATREQEEIKAPITCTEMEINSTNNHGNIVDSYNPISSNDSIRDSSYTETLNSQDKQGEEPLIKRASLDTRIDILKQLKEQIFDTDRAVGSKDQESDETPKSSSIINDPKYTSLPQKESSRVSIEFIGDQAMKGIVRFNTDTYLLGLNTFEVMSTFDNVAQTNKGIKTKLKQIGKLDNGIEKRQRKLNSNVDEMAAKLQAFRDLKKEVEIMNAYSKRKGGKGQHTQGMFTQTPLLQQQQEAAVTQHQQDNLAIRMNMSLGRSQEMNF